MTTKYKYNTGNPIGSTDVRDGVDNLKSFDVFMNAPEDEYNQRDGVISPTVRGAIKALGSVVTAWTFTTGGTLNYPNEAALNPVDGNYYSWAARTRTMSARRLTRHCQAAAMCRALMWCCGASLHLHPALSLFLITQYGS